MRFREVKYLFFALICMCVTPLITRAECDYQRQAELSRLASNVQLAYTYDGTNFTVYMTNLTPDLYAEDNYGRIYYGDGNEKTFNFHSDTVRFDIYSNDSACRGEKLLRKTINLPTINAYSLYDECKQYPNFKYCQKWGNFTITQEQFNLSLNNYKQELNAKVQSQIEEKSSVWEIILETLQNNVPMFIFFGVIIGLTVIVIMFRRRKEK